MRDADLFNSVAVYFRMPDAAVLFGAVETRDAGCRFIQFDGHLISDAGCRSFYL
jgi:hypothetical protein